MQGVLPLLGWAIMWAIGGYSLDQDWGTGSSYTSWTVPGVHWHIGGAFLLAAGALLLGVVLHVRLPGRRPAVLPRRGAEPQTP